MNLTIVIRSYNEMPYTGATLQKLLEQRRQDFDIVVIDTGSTDGSVEAFKEFARGPGKKYNLELIQIPVEEYNPGRVLNMGIGKSPHDIVVLLNADATPVDEFWLERLVEPLAQDEKIAATFSRQLPRTETKPLFALDTLRFYPEEGPPEWKRFVHYSHAACAVRKDVWQKYPISTECSKSEDIEWAHRIASSRYQILYTSDSVVYHAHNYTLGGYRRRMRYEGEDSVLIFENLRPSLPGSFKSCAGAIVRDIVWCVRRGHILSALYSPVLRLTQHIARYRGQRLGIQARSRKQSD